MWKKSRGWSFLRFVVASVGLEWHLLQRRETYNTMQEPCAFVPPATLTAKTSEVFGNEEPSSLGIDLVSVGMTHSELSSCETNYRHLKNTLDLPMSCYLLVLPMGACGVLNQLLGDPLFLLLCEPYCFNDQ